MSRRGVFASVVLWALFLTMFSPVVSQAVVVLPEPSTYVVEDIQEIRARFTGGVVDDGGEACDFRFVYWIKGSEYQYTPWDTDGLNDHENNSCGAIVDDLAYGEFYYTSLELRNSAGSKVYLKPYWARSFVTPARVIISSNEVGSVTAPGEGEFIYEYGVEVPIVAEPGIHWEFVGWTGTAVDMGLIAEPNAATTTYKALGDTTLKAMFIANYKVSSTRGGSVVAPGEGDLQEFEGTVIDLIASADKHYVFTGWTGSAVDAGLVADVTASTTTLTVGGGTEVIANFEPVPALVAYYKFDGDANEVFDAANNGVELGDDPNDPNNAGPVYVAGRLGQAVALDGVDDVVEIPRVVEHDWTIGLWFRTDDPNQDTGRPLDDRFWNSYGIIGGEVGGHVHDYSVGISGNAITFGVGLPKPEAVGTPWESTRNNQTLIAENAINDTDWHHIAVTRDVVSGEMAIFIDGELAMNEIPDPCYVPDPNDPNDLAPLVEVPAIAMGPTGYKDAPATLIIGAQRFNPKSGMMERSVAGELDDLKFYNYVLTADEIKNLLFKSMDAWYPMEAGEGTLVKDWSGNGNDVELTGTTMVPGWVDANLAPVAAGTNWALDFSEPDPNLFDATQVGKAISYQGVLGPQARTVTAWIRTDMPSVNHENIVSWGRNAATNRFTCKINSSAGNGAVGALRCEIQGAYATSNTVVTDGQWHHVAFVFAGGDGTTVGGCHDVLIYLDGQLEGGPGLWSGQSGNNRIINTQANPDSMLLIGNWNSLNRAWTGQLDEIRIFARDFSPAEIQDDMGPVPAPLANWTLDEGEGEIAADVTGNGYDGVVLGDPNWVSGVSGTALDLDGAGDYVECPNDPSLRLANALSVCGWVNIRSTPGPWRAIMTRGESSWRWAQKGKSTRMDLGWSHKAQGWPAVTSATALAFGEWYFVCATFDSTDGGHMYINGMPDGYREYLEPILENDAPVMIGDNSGSPGRNFDGMVDELRIYDVALTPNQVRLVQMGR